jgi:hypothetical protein
MNGGLVGVGSGTTATSLQFKNDAFGTSDFEAVKDLTGSFAATSYLKGENRGYSITNAKVKRDGVRQGEKESTAYSSQNEAYALVLNAEDWVKYLVDAPETDDYSLSLTVGKSSKGCVFEIIIDNQTIIKSEIPEDLEFAAVCVRREHYVVKHKYVGQVFAHSVERRVVSGAVAPPFKFYNDVFVSFIEFVNERLIVSFFGVYVATSKNKLNDFAAVERVPGFVVVYLIADSVATGKNRKR